MWFVTMQLIYKAAELFDDIVMKQTYKAVIKIMCSLWPSRFLCLIIKLDCRTD